MKKILLIISLILFALPVYAADYYIAQSAAGSGDGSDCANAKAIANLTWGAGNMGVAGNTIHLCGTITTTLTIGASGSAGNPITILFEEDAKLSKALWGATTTAAIYSTAKSYITIDGGTNGVIENLANGTGLVNHTDSTGIYLVQASNFTIKDLTIQNIYVRTADSDDSQRGTKGIWSINTRSKNVVDNVTVTFAEQGIHFYSSGATADGLTIKNCDISKVSTGIVVAMNSAHDYTNVVIEDSSIYDLYYWDGCWDSCTVWHHNDGIHTWGNYGSGANKIQITVKNNIIGGDFGERTTGWIYLSNYTSDVHIYNNLLYTTGEKPANGYITLNSKGTAAANIYNNTIKGAAANNTGGNGIYFTGSSAQWTVDIRNNVITSCYTGIYDSTTTPTIIISDYNDFYNNGSTGRVGGSWYTTVANWQTALGGCPNSNNDCSSITDDPKFVSSSDFRLQEGSPAIGAGDDSVSTYFTTDILGNARSDYDIGAYEYGGTADTTPPTISTATINAAGDTLTLLFDEVVTVNTSTGFTLGMSGGAAGLTYVSGSGSNTLVYSITGRNIDDDETGTLDYVTVANGIEDAAGNDLASTGESDESVTNNSTYSPSATTYTVTVQSSGNCVVSPLSNKVIVSGETASYTCTANGNSGCAAWTGTCGGTGTTSFTSSAVKGNCTVIQGCYKISPDIVIGAGSAVTLGTGAVGTLY